MSPRTGVTRYVMALCLNLLVTTTIVGCSSGGSAATTVSVTPSTSESSTTSPPVTLGQTDKELAGTAIVENKLAQYLSNQGITDNDPRLAIIYGLRARVQAFSCLKALGSGDTASADSAMRDIYSTINLGRGLAKDSVAATLESAYTTIKTLGNPSGAPDQAKQLLGTFISQLKPLMDDANAITAATTTAS